ncbi:hypothetical protein RFM26_28325 [Mesorhizobium sp. VK23B]|uniref:Uncharacterized protein n=1 Tax=Mesorhizobium dulcispinae TaxID=3072316 RepID=A0ABU4XMK3_9HYPH|nr:MULTISPECIES: hypothetical protein [unclassified Mesorhizobium]MDX8469608.1 hypothetical protein [Mesorhizobium sp. VK23B]MDX8475975.1 hypothetical protein [Mesorhizobium sp. VK23A]
MTASERARLTLQPVRTACSALMALLVLALVGFAQAEVSASTAAASGGAGISAARQGETLALLRVTGKAQAVEARAGRPLPIKLVSGNPGALALVPGFVVAGKALSAQARIAPVLVAAPRSHANQPRAPPTA